MISSLTALQRRFAAPLAASCLALAVSAMPQSAHAADVTLTAEFKPSVLNPTNNKFTNTTPNTGICVYESSSICVGGVKSFAVHRITARYDNLARGDAINMKVPSEPRTVIVENEYGQQQAVSFKLAFMGGRYGLPAWAMDIAGGSSWREGHNRLWSGENWDIAPRPCSTGVVASVYDGDEWNFAWKLPASSAFCGKQTNFDLAWVNIDRFSLAYELHTPNPLNIANGTYTGKLTLLVGPGQEIDFGNNATLTGDSELTLNFVLKVENEFKVTFPDSSPRVSLVPIGGWQQWTGHNRKPARLQAELPFALTSSIDFSVKLRCNGTPSANGHCPLADGANPDAAGTAEVKVDVTMPSVSSTLDGKPASHFPLVQRAGVADARFRPNGYIANRHSRLRFIVDNEGDASLDRMLARPGSHWEGEMTLIFDSEP